MKSYGALGKLWDPNRFAYDKKNPPSILSITEVELDDDLSRTLLMVRSRDESTLVDKLKLPQPLYIRGAFHVEQDEEYIDVDGMRFEVQPRLRIRHRGQWHGREWVDHHTSETGNLYAQGILTARVDGSYILDVRALRSPLGARIADNKRGYFLGVPLRVGRTIWDVTVNHQYE